MFARHASFYNRMQHHNKLPQLIGVLVSALLGATCIIVLYQIPATHHINIGTYDAAYVQGFHDPQQNAYQHEPYLAGSDGSVRWSNTRSYVLLPQAGLPADVTLRVRGYRPDAHLATENQSHDMVVELWLNSQQQLATLPITTVWQTYHVTIPRGHSGMLKPTDVVLELRSPVATLPDEGRSVGVLLDEVCYTVPAATLTSSHLIIPYPMPVLYGALIAALLWLVLRPYTHHTTRTWVFIRVSAVVLPYALFLVYYRLQPPWYPYPLRWILPAIIGVLLVVLIVRHTPSLVHRFAWLPHMATLLIGVGWVFALLIAANDHVTLSVPGVEKDFRVFATRSTQLADVFKGDGFYHLGYPLLLWLIQPFTHMNAFLAGRLIAAVSGGVLFAATGLLAHSVLQHQSAQPTQRAGGVLVAVLVLASSPLVVQYSLYVGSDMPFAACTTMALALFCWHMSMPYPRRGVLVAAGAAAGAAFLMRHAGSVLVLWATVATMWLMWQRSMPIKHLMHITLHRLLPFGMGFLLVASPQLVVNSAATGNPFYNQQAKNVWLAVHGNTDWGRWHEAPDSIPLSEVVLQDPARFVQNWTQNIAAFIGTGAESNEEQTRALQLHVLSLPANWIAIAGLLWWLWRVVSSFIRQATQPTHHHQDHQDHQQQVYTVSYDVVNNATSNAVAALLLFVVLYVAVSSMAFVLPRFFVCFAPIYAVAAASLLHTLSIGQSVRRVVASVLLLLVLLSNGVGTGTRYVLHHQPSDDVAVVALVQHTVAPDEYIVAHVDPDVALHKYSAIAHHMVLWDDATAPAATYVLWDKQFDDVADSQMAAYMAMAQPVGRAGRYTLFQLASPAKLPH